MHTMVTLLPLLGALLLVAGTIVTLFAIWHAPLGVETSDGFHPREESRPAARKKMAPESEPLIGGLA